MDTKRLPLLSGETKETPREYLFIGIDDFSRELYAGIFPDKTQLSSTGFLKQVIEECPYSIKTIYTDNGSEYKGNPHHHAFVKGCLENRIHQQFTQSRRPQTNGKAERVIRTIMDMWHEKTTFKNKDNRRLELIRFVNYYNTVKPHQGIDNLTPMEKLINYFYPTEL
jgi:transposase InsO family protein